MIPCSTAPGACAMCAGRGGKVSMDGDLLCGDCAGQILADLARTVAGPEAPAGMDAGVTVDRYGPPDRPDFEIGLRGEHVHTFTAGQAAQLYAALGRALAAAS